MLGFIDNDLAFLKYIVLHFKIFIALCKSIFMKSLRFCMLLF